MRVSEELYANGGVVEKILNKFGYFKRNKNKRQYKDLRYKEPDTPEVNSERLIELMVEGNEWARNKKKEDYQLIGMFFTVVLMIEHKMINLLKCIDDGIEDYRLLIHPLNEIKKIRNAMAHDITKPIFSYKDLPQTDSCVKKSRADMYDKFKDCEDDRAKCIALISTFGFIFSFEVAKLRIGIEP